MGTVVDLIGQRFNRLLVVERVENSKNRKARWKCVCDCGNVKIATSQDLKRGHTQSCGCLHDEVARINGQKIRHGQSHTRIHRIWTQMKTRCFNPNKDNYELYGGRGITVCDEWRNSFETFYEWAMQNGYQAGLTIDRINPDGNYEPANCRWATPKWQSRNRRDTVFVEINGQMKSLSEWCEIKEVPYISAYQRYKKGFVGEEIFNFKRRNSKRKERK